MEVGSEPTLKGGWQCGDNKREFEDSFLSMLLGTSPISLAGRLKLGRKA